MVHAYFWLTLCAEKGNALARQLQSQIPTSEGALSGREIAQVNRMLDEFHKAHPDPAN